MPQQYEIPCGRNVGCWDEYYALKDGMVSSALAAEAISKVTDLEHTEVLDLGAGPMVDARFMLSRGAKSVVAVDACPDAQNYAMKVKGGFGPRFDFQNVRFCDFNYSPESFGWVHSNYGLPYHGRLGFEKLIKAVTESVRVGGLLSAILLGERDEWNVSGSKHSDLAFFHKEEVEGFLAGFDFVAREHCAEGYVWGAGCGDATTKRKPKFWHTFTVIARRVSPVL